MIGETVSHYKIIDKIGGGGMGVVYKAHDSKLKRTVALKFLPPAFSSEPEAKERFIHEARTASALDHPNICNIFDIDETEDGQSFIAMAYYEGMSLKERIKDGPLELNEAINITVQLISGLKRAHDKGIVHRDIKPANIMITDHGEVKILDFGLAKLAGQTKLTKTGTTMGTTSYMSPEQVRGEMVDQRSDIWSLGVVIYEMLSGQSPFPGEYEQAVMYSILNEDSAPLSDFRGDVPDVLDKVVSKTISKNLEGRYQDMDALLADLVELKGQPEVGELTIWPKRKRLSKAVKKSLLLYGGLALIGALVIFSFWYFLILGVDKIDSIAVLPLDNISDDPGQERFVDGMTIELIAELARISAFERIISWTSVERYKEIKKPLPEIARELNVKAIVEGSVMREGDNIRINASLIEPSSEKRIWTDTYEKSEKRILELLTSLSKSIAEKINLKLSPAEELRLSNPREVNPEAVNDYLMAKYFFSKRDFQKAIAYFEQAIKLDSTFVAAYIDLGYCYYGLVTHWHSLSKTLPLVRKVVYEAMELDSTSSETIASLAMLRFLEWKWAEAIALYKKALSINPNNMHANVLFGALMIHIGKFEEGIKAQQRYFESDPLTVMANNQMAYAYYNAGNYDQAITYSRRMLEMDSTQFPAHYFITYSYIAKSMTDKALQIAQEQNFEQKNRVVAAVVYAAAGLHEKAKELVKDVTDFSHSYDLVSVYVLLNQHEYAIDLMERAYEEHEIAIYGAKVNPFYKPLHAYPRYQGLLRRINFPDD